MPSPLLSDAVRSANARYWRRNIKLTLTLLAVWFLAGLGCGVLFVEPLNAYKLGGFPLGFWFAQQGAILIFVGIVLIYAIGMAWLDRLHRADMRRAQQAQPQQQLEPQLQAEPSQQSNEHSDEAAQ